MRHLRARPRHHDWLAGDAAGLMPQLGLALDHVKLAQPVGKGAGRLGSHAVRIPVFQALAPEKQRQDTSTATTSEVSVRKRVYDVQALHVSNLTMDATEEGAACGDPHLNIGIHARHVCAGIARVITHEVLHLHLCRLAIQRHSDAPALARTYII